MPKYQVPVTRHVIDVYEVEARNSNEALVAVGVMLAEGKPPAHSREQSRKVLSAVSDPDKFVPSDPATRDASSF